MSRQSSDFTQEKHVSDKGAVEFNRGAVAGPLLSPDSGAGAAYLIRKRGISGLMGRAVVGALHAFKMVEVKEEAASKMSAALETYAEAGRFAPQRIAENLQITETELARTAGLDDDAFARPDRVGNKAIQKRLREMAEIFNRIMPRFGSAEIAYAWYRSEPLPGLADLTPMQLVREGHADDVMGYIDAVDAGVHA